MSNVYDIWLYPLQDWWRTVEEMLDFMYTGQIGNFILCVEYYWVHQKTLHRLSPQSHSIEL